MPTHASLSRIENPNKRKQESSNPTRIRLLNAHENISARRKHPFHRKCQPSQRLITIAINKNITYPFTQKFAVGTNQIFHNYIRPHEGLDGKTPSEACGIKIEGKNKWLTLIQNASKQN